MVLISPPSTAYSASAVASQLLASRRLLKSAPSFLPLPSRTERPALFGAGKLAEMPSVALGEMAVKEAKAQFLVVE